MEHSSRQRLDNAARQAVLHLAWLVPCLIILALMFHHDYSGLYRADAMDAAQAARRISEGRGFSTGFIRPLSTACFPRLENHPDLYQPPLYPLVLGLVFCVSPANDRTVALTSCFFFFVTLILTFLLARRMFGGKAAGLSVLLLALNLPLLQIVLSGAPVVFWTFLLTLLLFFIFRHRGSPGASLAVGLLFGLCILAEYASLFILPAVLWLLFSVVKERKWRHFGVFALGSLLVLAPWGIRNLLLTGNPLFSLRWYLLAMFGGTYPGFSVLRESAIPEGEALGFVFSHPMEMLKKFVLGLRGLYNGFPLICGLYVLPFFIAGILLQLDDARAHKIRKGLYAAILLLGIGSAITTGAAELFSPLIPLIVIFSAASFAGFLRLSGAGMKLKAAAAGLLVIVAGLPVLVNLLLPATQMGPRRENLAQLAAVLPEKVLVASDIPWAVAWYGERDCVWLPKTEIRAQAQVIDPTQSEDFARIDGPDGKIGAIFLSSHILTYPAGEKLTGWQMMSAVPEGFRLEGVLAGGEVLLMRDDTERENGQSGD
jgi:4-amino-4-deoxy-L-arabinose transferase-like glycosyltransferase